MNPEKLARIFLSSPHMSGEEEKFIQEAFKTNCITTGGPIVADFEFDLKRYLGYGEVVALNSGTAAIHLGLILLGVKSGDEVICQSLTFSASANPILYLGAIPVFIDSELKTWNLCPIALEEAIRDRIAKGKKPKAIIAVDLYGIPYQIEAIRFIANKYDIPILEDSAEALGSTYKGKKCGTFGDIGVLSFNGNKIITTSGGGAIITSNESFQQKALFLATQAKDNAPHYQHSEIGYNYRMSNISAGIGRGQLEVLDTYLELRRKNNDFYIRLLINIEGISVFNVKDEDYFSNHWLTVILIDPELTGGVTREDVRLALEKENIESRPAMKPLHLQPIFEQYPYYGTDVATKIFEQSLCLPSGSNLSEKDFSRIQLAFLNLFDF